MVNSSVFFPRENQKCPWKPFLPIFSIFFTRGKSFSRALFSVFSRFLHGYTNRFHGRSLSKKLSFSRGNLLKIFHGHRFFFTGGIWLKSSRARFSFHGHFLGKNLVFSREDFIFSRVKKKHCMLAPDYTVFRVRRDTQKFDFHNWLRPTSPKRRIFNFNWLVSQLLLSHEL